jgi:hypothetical protein
MTIGTNGFSDSENYPAWDINTTYAAGDKVIRSVPSDHLSIDIPNIDYIFEAAGNNTTSDPATDPLGWINLGAPDNYKAFDNTATTQGFLEQNEYVEVLAHRVSAVFLGQMESDVLIEMRIGDSDDIIFSKEVFYTGLIYNPTSGWYDYFYPELIEETGSQDVFVEFPTNDYNMRIRITALKDNGAKIGRIAVGSLMDIGETKISPNIGIIDYSVKETDANGNTILKVRKFAKRAEIDVLIKTNNFDVVLAVLSRLRARPTAWIGSGKFSALVLYGFFRDFSLILSGENYSDCSLQLEGLT